MVDLYCYESVTVTSLLEDSVNHLLSSDIRGSISVKLVRELEEWKDSEKGREIEKCVECEDGKKLMSFDLVQQIQKQLKETPLDDRLIHLHELLKGSDIIFPRYKPPPRSPELVARLEKIKVKLENEEYNKMIGTIDNKPDLLQDIKLDVQATHRQMWMVMNFVLTVIGSFVFGYFAAYFAGIESTWCFMTGLIFGLAVFFADLYFIAKSM